MTTNDDYAVFVDCSDSTIFFYVLEYILNVPFFIYGAVWQIPTFFIYGLLIDPSEPLLTARLFLLTILTLYLEILSVMYFFKLLRSLIRKWSQKKASWNE